MYKLIGAGLILGASLWAGLHAALCLRRTGEELRELRAALALMSGEILYADTPFAPLCRRAGEGRREAVRRFFSILAQAVECPEAETAGLSRRACAKAGLRLPGAAQSALARLFDSFGRLDRESQLRQLQLAAAELDRLDAELRAGMEGRCRACEVLGLSAGAAVLILVL